MQNSTNEPTMTDSQIEAWQVVVPLIIITAVIVITVILVVVIVFYKNHKQRMSAVFPVAERTLEGDGHCEGRESEWTNSRKDSMEATLVSISGSDDLEVTRTRSLAVLIPRGKKLNDVFATSAGTDIGEFKEPDEIDGKVRWQIIQLYPSDQSSEHSLSNSSQTEDDDVTEVVYRQGVYMTWEDTLCDLRNAFIETNQLDPEDMLFLFLQSDVLGEYIEIDSENTLCLGRLNYPVIESKTLYIESVDPCKVQNSLCVCGKYAQLECTTCCNRGYCSSECEQSDSPKHQLDCSNTLVHNEDSHNGRRNIDVIQEEEV